MVFRRFSLRRFGHDLQLIVAVRKQPDKLKISVFHFIAFRPFHSLGFCGTKYRQNSAASFVTFEVGAGTGIATRRPFLTNIPLNRRTFLADQWEYVAVSILMENFGFPFPDEEVLSLTTGQRYLSNMMIMARWFSRVMPL
jgi:hypothetical protein